MTVFEALSGSRAVDNLVAPAPPARHNHRPGVAAAVDAGAGLVAAFAAVALTGELTGTGLTVPGLVLVAAAVAGWPAACFVAGGYRRFVLGSAGAQTVSVLRAMVFLLALLGAAAYLTGAAPARSAVLAGLPALLAATAIGRFCLGRLLRPRVRHLLVVGSEAQVRDASARLVRARRYGRVVAGIVPQADGEDLRLPDGVPLLRDLSRLDTAIDLVEADTVLVAAGTLSERELRDLAWRLEARGVDLAVLPGLLDVEAPRLSLRVEDGLSILGVAPPAREGAVVALKHGLDRVLAAGMLLTLAPLLLAVALGVRATSAGPAVFRQVRIGKDGKPFTLYKFRTMVAEAEAQREVLLSAGNDADGPLFKLREDPRVTSLGRFLRKHSLDELPQLLNVVRGEMSLVGPRPPLPVEVAAYSSEVSRRLLVRPGLTGLWQVSGRSDLSWEDSVRLDLRYVDNVSLRHDADILRRTVGTVLNGGGAY